MEVRQLEVAFSSLLREHVQQQQQQEQQQAQTGAGYTHRGLRAQPKLSRQGVDRSHNHSNTVWSSGEYTPVLE